ncbi:MAG: diaminopimelate decarboxylase [Synergistaceae bacterium]|jgi:diaminopimelate decarboxylase|nr:diaminopimelate decarboxylase [Synergistaceae bacterium]
MGNFIFHGCDAAELAREFGTPLYVMSEDEAIDRIRAVKSCFDDSYERCRTHFASKSFLSRDMLGIIESEGLGLDVVSGGELYLARDEGFPPEKIAFHGNSKTDSEIRDALEYRIGKFVCDSLQEIAAIGGIARAVGARAKILIRVNPGVEGNTHRHMLTSGGRTKFGIRSSEIADAVSLCMGLENIELGGFHFHVGSQLMDNSAHLAALDVLLGLIKRLKVELGFDTEVLDMGGGFGVAYTDLDKPAPIDEFIRPMVGRVCEFCASNGIFRPDLIIEPGRFIAGPSGITLYTVCSVKEVPGVAIYAGVDGGFPDNPRPALYEAKYDAVIADKFGEPRTETVTIAGKCCESGDILIRDIALPHVERGNIIAVLCTGAYNHSMASNYNKNPVPAVVAIRGGVPRVSVRRQTYADIFACDSPKT